MEQSVRIAGVIRESIVDGPGIRFVIFCQGCVHNCPGCHNPQTHDFEGGSDCSFQKILEAVEQDPLVKGVTFSGGEPFCQAKAMSALARSLLERGYDVWTYSGYTFEELMEMAKEDPDVKRLLESCSVLIDGRYLQEQKSMDLPYRGSKNQRIIDLAASMEKGEPVLWREREIN